MFVQHMLASLKPDGHMATVMPHGVLFRGGKEKLIREIFINDDVIEAIGRRQKKWSMLSERICYNQIRQK
jgi:type I restriction-modification system DNA methylase subunit